MSRARRSRWIALAAAALAGLALATALDEPVYRAIDPSLESRARLDRAWWYLGLRHLGSFWLWLAVGAALLGASRLRGRGAERFAGLRVMLAAGAAGLAAEALKLVIGRERPATIRPTAEGVEALVYQGHVFRGLFSGFTDGSNLGLPSSHAATAAGGALALGLLWPRLWWPGLAAAGGCGLSRLLTGAHFLSDVYLGIVVGWLAALWIAGRGHARTGADA